MSSVPLGREGGTLFRGNVLTRGNLAETRFTHSLTSEHTDMSKSFIIKVPKATHRNLIAREMILNGTGRTQIMKDRRDKRSKDARRKREAFDCGE